MMNAKPLLLPAIGLLLLQEPSSAQTKAPQQQSPTPKTWQLLDIERDGVYGTSANRACKELLQNKKSHPVIVAVIDEGVDITHEALKGHIYINTKEITGNGLDDDKNGYSDDIHGWNFLGGKDGKKMYAESSEADREYARLLPLFGVGADSNQKGYGYFVKVKETHIADSTGKAHTLNPQFLIAIPRFAHEVAYLQSHTQTQHIYFNEVNAFQPKDSIGDTAKRELLDFYTHFPARFKAMPLDSLAADRMQYLESQKKLIGAYAELKPDPNGLRKEIVGDDPFNINDVAYGNNNVDDSEHGFHGTFCSAIITGIAGNSVIMPLRATPTYHYCDERDKDIALAIRYAVDNGAKVISMSFGKYLSPQKQWVDDAVRYAEKKGVLLVHGAGNDHTDNDSAPFYPDANYSDLSGRAGNMITVGAISKDTSLELTASFSNYGRTQVDLFAPGVDVYSAAPQNTYRFDSGTSYAAPMVAGVAALILEYHPTLDAVQVKEIILRSVTPLKGKAVRRPGTKEEVDFSTLCATGGVVNAYKALLLAEGYK